MPQTVSSADGNLIYTSPTESKYRSIQPRLNKDLIDLVAGFKHRLMVNDARYIYSAGGGVLAGAVHQKADYVVGNAWRPQYTGADPDWKRIAEPVVEAWMDVCDVRGHPYTFQRNLWIASKLLDVDGDFFIIPTFAQRDLPAFMFLEAHRVGQRIPGEKRFQGGRFNGAKISNGIIYGRHNRMIGAQVLGETPEEDQVFDATNIIHVTDPVWFSQGRGIPRVSFGISHWYDSAKILEAEKTAVLVNSKLSLIERTKSGTANVAKQHISGGSVPAASASTEPPEEQLIADGLIRYIAAKGDIQAHTSARPGQTWEGFMDYVTRAGLRGIDWPFELAWKMEGLRGQAARAIGNAAQRAVENRQSALFTPALSALLHGVLGLINRGDLPFVNDWFRWSFTMPPKWSIDIGRDGQNDRENLRMGIANQTELQRVKGRNLEEHYRERAREWRLKQQIAAETGVPMEAFGFETPNGNPPSAA